MPSEKILLESQNISIFQTSSCVTFPKELIIQEAKAMSHLAGHDAPAVDVVNRREKLERGLVLLLMENSDVFPPKAQMCKFYGTSEGYFYTAHIH